MKPRSLAPVFALAFLAGWPLAQTPVVVLQHGDPLPGGFVTSLRALEVEDDGGWIARGTFTDPSLTQREVYLRDGAIVLIEGLPVPVPAGAFIDEVVDASWRGDGTFAAILEVLQPGSLATSGVYLNTRALLLSGDSLPIAPLSPMTNVIRFEQVSANGAGAILVQVKVTDPDIPGFLDEALLLLEVDDQGNVLEIEVVAAEAQPSPMGFGTVRSVPEHFLTINARGDVLFDADARENSIWQDFVQLNDDVLVKDEDPSPLGGAGWTLFREGALNDEGEVVLLGSVVGNRDIVATPQRLVAAEGDPVPARPAYSFTGFGRPRGGRPRGGDVWFTNAGEVVYRGSWSSTPPLTDEAVFVEDEIVFEDRVTLLAGLSGPVASFPAGLNDFAVSPGGRYVLLGVFLADGTSALALLDLGRVTPLDDCRPNEGRLYREEGFAVLGATVRLALDGGQSVGALPVLALSDRTVVGFPPCGLPLPFGELVIDLGATNPFLILTGTPWSGAPATIDLAIQNNPLLVDQTVWAQGFFLAPGTSEPLRLTNAVGIEIGAP